MVCSEPTCNRNPIGAIAIACSFIFALVVMFGCGPTQKVVIQDPSENGDQAQEMHHENDDNGDNGDNQNNENGVNEVTVELNEFSIDMPDSVEAGQTRFIVSNVGRLTHNLRIEGQGFDQSLEEDLEPGESGEMTIELKPGTYRVTCPVGSHAAMGMIRQLTVEEMPHRQMDGPQ